MQQGRQSSRFGRQLRKLRSKPTAQTLSLPLLLPLPALSAAPPCFPSFAAWAAAHAVRDTDGGGAMMQMAGVVVV